MSTALRVVSRAAVAAAIAAMLLLPSHVSAQTPERKPMTIEDVHRMVEQGVRPQTILAALRQNCLAVYGLNSEMQRRLIAAGAEPELLDGLASVCWGPPGLPVMDPTRPFIMMSEPREWLAVAPQPASVAPGAQIRVAGLAHAPSGVRSVEVEGERVQLSRDADGGVRFAAVVPIRSGMNEVEVTLYPEEGDPFRKVLPLSLTAAPVGAGAAERSAGSARQLYNPTAIAMGGVLVPGLAQFRTGNTVMGVGVLGAAAGAAAAGLLSEETAIRCAADADPCPPGAILSESSSRPLLVPGLAAAAGITVLGAILGYRAAKSANARAAGGSDGPDMGGASDQFREALLRRLPQPDADGRWTLELARISF